MNQLNDLDLKVALLLGVVLAAVYYFVFFDSGKNIKSQISNIQTDIDIQKKTLDGIEDAFFNKKKFEENAASINSNIESFMSYFPRDLNASRTNAFIKEISKAAEENAATVVSLKPGNSIPEFEDYPEVAFEFVVEASFSNIMHFISDLTKLKRVIDFTDTALKVVGSEKVPRISFETTLIVYGFTGTITAQKSGVGG